MACFLRDLRLKIFLVYKSSLRDSISTWMPRGKNATLDVINHGNRVFETRFISQNRVFETRDVSKIYTFKTVPTN